MPTFGERKTVQARILDYAEAIGWTIVSREEVQQRLGFDPEVPPAYCAKGRSLFFDDLLDAKVREFNPHYTGAEAALLGAFRHQHTDIYGNRDFVEHLRNRGKCFEHEENRERDLILINYDDPAKSVYEVTEGWAVHNGHYGKREHVVFLINGIPVLVIECKNANKEEAIALGVDQNGAFYGSFGDGLGRSWSAARKFGFFSAGDGSWYSQTLKLLSPGGRIWVRVPKQSLKQVVQHSARELEKALDEFLKRCND